MVVDIVVTWTCWKTGIQKSLQYYFRFRYPVVNASALVGSEDYFPMTKIEGDYLTSKDSAEKKKSKKS